MISPIGAFLSVSSGFGRGLAKNAIFTAHVFHFVDFIAPRIFRRVAESLRFRVEDLAPVLVNVFLGVLASRLVGAVGGGGVTVLFGAVDGSAGVFTARWGAAPTTSVDFDLGGSFFLPNAALRRLLCCSVSL